MKQSNELTFIKPINAWYYNVKDIDKHVGDITIFKGEDNEGFIAKVVYREEDPIREGKRILVGGYGEKWARKAWDERIQREKKGMKKCL